MTRPLTDALFWEKHYGDAGPSYPSRLSRSDCQLMREMHPFLNQRREKRLFEAGCGNSYWLPYFARRYKLQVSGADFSPTRLLSAEHNLRKARVAGKLIFADIMVEVPTAHYDIVCSFGLIEHFADQSAILSQLSCYLDKNGIMLTTVPLLNGFWGRIAQKVNRCAAEGYVGMDVASVLASHESAGLQVIHYVKMGWGNFGVLNLAALPVVCRCPTIAAVAGMNLLMMCSNLDYMQVLPKQGYTSVLVVSKVKES